MPKMNQTSKSDGVVAQRNMVAISPSGLESEFNITVSLPIEAPDGNWYCETDAGWGDRVIKIAGVDSWQALEEAIKFCRKRAQDREGQGWKFRWPGEEEFATFR